MSYRRIPSYVYKARQGYVLQRAVPTDVLTVIGRAKFKEPGGTLQEARARVPAFIARTDQEIAIARGQVQLSIDEQIDRLAYEADRQDPEMQELLLEGACVDSDLSDAQRERMVAVVTGQLIPEPLYTAQDLIGIATRLKQPAKRTHESWCKQLDLFLKFCSANSPLSCTKQQAASYRTYLLSRVSPATAKTTLNYLSGLWSILEEVKPSSEHIFKGLAKRIKVIKYSQDKEIKPIENWSGSIYIPVFKVIYYTGARLGEISGLRSQDILKDRILIRPTTERSLKSSASEREIPIHAELQDLLSSLRNQEGYLWPSLESPNGRWGHNLSKSCKSVTGVNPHAFRHRVATCLRDKNFNEATIGKLLGHEPNTVTGSYGSVPWIRLVDAVSSL